MTVRYVGEQLPLHKLSHQQLAVVGLGGRVMMVRLLMMVMRVVMVGTIHSVILKVVGLGGRVMIMMISGHDESVKPQSHSELEKHA